jgi:hypothetical protein
VRRPIENPILDVSGEFPPVIINPYSFAAAAAFSPLDISGCVLWLEADTLVGYSNGDPVGLWEDASGVSGDASSSGSARPAYIASGYGGMPGLNFTTAANLSGTMTVTGSVMTVVLVGEVSSAGHPESRMFSVAATGGNDITSNDGAIFGGRFYGSTLYARRNNNNLASVSASYITPYVISTRFNGSTCEMFLNGAAGSSASSSGAFTIGKYAVGANAGNLVDGWMAGKIYAVLAYDESLSNTDREAIEDYLGDKYGITITH